MAARVTAVASIPPAAAFVALAAAILLGGCIASAPPQPRSWVVSAPRRQVAEVDVGRSAKVGAVTVSAPYDRAAMVVMRPDGSVAFDPCNAFAGSPAALLRSPLASLLGDAGAFGLVLPSAGSARVDATIEANVSNLSLDCREGGRRVARAALSLSVVENRSLVEILYGEGEADASAGDYSAAFSEAFAKAVSAALATSSRAGRGQIDFRAADAKMPANNKERKGRNP